MPIGGSFRAESNQSNMAPRQTTFSGTRCAALVWDAINNSTSCFCHDIVTACRIASLKPWSCIKLKEIVTEGP